MAEGRGRLNGAGADTLPNGSQWASRYEWEDGFAYTAPVDQYGAKGRNGYGLADMLGNAWEWCLDWFDPAGPHSEPYTREAQFRVIRGGSFHGPPGLLRCAFRDRDQPSIPSAINGFRVCRGPVVVR